jgi:hypothetical protein
MAGAPLARVRARSLFYKHCTPLGVRDSRASNINLFSPGPGVCL